MNEHEGRDHWNETSIKDLVLEIERRRIYLDAKISAIEKNSENIDRLEDRLARIERDITGVKTTAGFIIFVISSIWTAAIVFKDKLFQ